jgi:hypothetical protein
MGLTSPTIKASTASLIGDITPADSVSQPHFGSDGDELCGQQQALQGAQRQASGPAANQMNDISEPLSSLHQLRRLVEDTRPNRFIFDHSIPYLFPAK